MTPSKGALLTGTGALLLGASLALSSVATVAGANQIQPDKNTISCDKTTACITGMNSGRGPGVKGVSTHAAVPSGNANGAVFGSALGENGVYGYSAQRSGGWFENDTGLHWALEAQADQTYGNPFAAVNTVNGTYFEVNFEGGGDFTGSVTATGYYTDLRTRDGVQVRAFGAESTRATIEDTGTARLANGEGAVRFDSGFARTLDLRQGYQVFLTPDGDTRGLYVAAKYEGGFIIRENGHGRSSVNFDYRVVAHPYGSSEARLPGSELDANDPAARPGDLTATGL